LLHGNFMREAMVSSTSVNCNFTNYIIFVLLVLQDWWNSTNFRDVPRKWNLIVHSWLYTYIYKDVYDMVAHNRTLAATAVFLISFVVHEYIMAFGLGFFYPVMFIVLFGVGFPLFLLPKVVSSNIFVWIAVTLNQIIVLSLYSIEFYARRNNCPPHPDYYIDLFIPRSWSCQEQFNPFNPLFTSTVKSCNETMDYPVTEY
jgi:sterol O-acyltransferase